MKARSDTSPFLPFDANSLGDLLTHHFSGHWLVFLDAATAEKAKQYGEEATESFLTFLKANQSLVRFIPTAAIPDLMLTAPQPIMFIDLSLFRWIKALPFNVSNETAEPAVISYDDTPARVLAYRPNSKGDGLFVYPLPDGALCFITPDQAAPIYLQNDFASTRQPPLHNRHRDSSITIAAIPAGLAFWTLLSPSFTLGSSLKSILFFWTPLTFALLGLHHLIHLLCPNHGRRLRLLIDTIKGKPNLFYHYRDKPTPLRTIALFFVEILGFLLLVAFFGFVFSHTFAPNANATRPSPDTQSQGGTDADLLAQLQRLHAIAQLQLIDVTTNAPPAAQQAAATSRVTADTLAPHVRVGTPLRIHYDGTERIIHPYRLGANPRTGKLLLRAWEESKAGAPTRGFRTYAVSKIERATPIHGRAPIDLPDAAWRPDKTIPNPIAQRPAPTSQTHKSKE